MSRNTLAFIVGIAVGCILVLVSGATNANPLSAYTTGGRTGVIGMVIGYGGTYLVFYLVDWLTNNDKK